MTYQWGLGGALGALALSFAFQITLNQRVIKTVLSKYSGNRTVSPAERNSMLKFSIPIALQDSSFTIVHTLSLLILIRLSNYGEVGLSSAAGMWLSVVIFVPAMLKNVMFSYLSSAENHIRLVHKLLIINFISSVTPVSIVLCCSGFISSFYGTSFIGLPKVLNVCVVSAIFISLSEVYCYEFIAQGKTMDCILFPSNTRRSHSDNGLYPIVENSHRSSILVFRHFVSSTWHFFNNHLPDLYFLLE